MPVISMFYGLTVSMYYLDTNMNPRVKSVEYKNPFRLTIVFLNEEQKEFDLSPYLHYPIYESLCDETYCRKVKVIAGTVAWSDDIDFDPDRLYEESKVLQEA
jgi:Protein of unknown function (DUF2442)